MQGTICGTVGFRITGDRERREVQRHEGASDITRDREIQPCDVEVSGGKIGDEEVRPCRGSGETGDRKKAKSLEPPASGITGDTKMEELEQLVLPASGKIGDRKKAICISKIPISKHHA
ncbi:hypothetical protein VitviT2T_010177 [Vitis vinifera]|uniref:Uncharacterized protein n=1 Tax=Vitis vinifera TaxID=29760 RepID=A0ABY9C8D1_VITVI|nr:hypothetical protein VitviT2T_010177 [Vitis vinifera]